MPLGPGTRIDDNREIYYRSEKHIVALRAVVHWTDELRQILASGGVR